MKSNKNCSQAYNVFWNKEGESFDSSLMKCDTATFVSKNDTHGSVSEMQALPLIETEVDVLSALVPLLIIKKSRTPAKIQFCVVLNQAL